MCSQDLGSFIFPARLPEAASPYQGSLSHIKGNRTHQTGAEGPQSRPVGGEGMPQAQKHPSASGSGVGLAKRVTSAVAIARAETSDVLLCLLGFI